MSNLFPASRLLRRNDRSIHTLRPRRDRSKIDDPAVITNHERLLIAAADQQPIRRAITQIVRADLIRLFGRIAVRARGDTAEVDGSGLSLAAGHAEVDVVFVDAADLAGGAHVAGAGAAAGNSTGGSGGSDGGDDDDGSGNRDGGAWEGGEGKYRA